MIRFRRLLVGLGLAIFVAMNVVPPWRTAWDGAFSGYSFIWAPKAGRSTVDIPLLAHGVASACSGQPCRVFLSRTVRNAGEQRSKGRWLCHCSSPCGNPSFWLGKAEQ